LIRHWIYDTLEPLRWSRLDSSFGHEIEGFSALAGKVAREERFHRHHAEQLLTKLGLANTDANVRLQRCIDSLVPRVGTLIEVNQIAEAWQLLEAGAGRSCG
jgi:1,2-phenylacetyl-CoA epoxidase catalytic subunit